MTYFFYLMWFIVGAIIGYCVDGHISAKWIGKDEDKK